VALGWDNRHEKGWQLIPARMVCILPRTSPLSFWHAHLGSANPARVEGQLLLEVQLPPSPRSLQIQQPTL
jgi:hypothetical protein